MSSFRKRLRALVERLAGFESVRREARVVGTVQYIFQRRRIFEELCIDLVLDVGANTGQFAQELRTFYKGEIISFEPVSTAFASLARTASGDSLWSCHKLALGQNNSIQSINISRQTAFSSFLKVNKYCAGRFDGIATVTDEESVSVRRLDEVLEEIVPNSNDKRIFLKIDTQGYDMEVFKGLGNKLEQVVALQSELSVIPAYEAMLHWTDSISFFEQAGFTVAGLFPVCMDRSAVIEFDCLMDRNEPLREIRDSTNS